MSAIQLTPLQRKEHRAAAHHLQPVVMIGSDGLTPAVQKEVERALDAHGLIKVRVFSDDRATRDALLSTLADTCGAAAVQHIGKLLVLWRPKAEKTAVEDADGKPGPRMVKVLKFSKSGNHRPQVKRVRVMGNERVTAGGLVKRAKVRRSSVKKG
jgi:putative YhbY family RNA-binding protein